MTSPDTVASESAVALLQLLQLAGVGAVKVRDAALAADEGTSEGMWGALTQRWPKLATPSARAMAEAAADAIIRDCRRLRICIIGIADREYPAQLKTISDPPPVLYVRGSVESLSGLGIAVVGTREASEKGLKIARRVSAVAVHHGFVVVSGLALGIDTAAHRSALDQGGVTIAVLAHGLDTVAPSSNRELAQEIEEQRGALVSEHPPGVPPRRAEFVRRNRLQSGLSKLSVIVESGIVGGAIHQARFTKAQGRILCAVVPREPLGDFRTEGGRYLVQNEGATAIEDSGQLGALLVNLKASPETQQRCEAEVTTKEQAEIRW